MEPLNDFVLVEVEPPTSYAQDIGLSRIIIPPRYEHGPRDRAVFGTVLKKGPECLDSTVQYRSRVVIEKWRGAYLNPARTLMMVRETDILAVIDGHCSAA